MTARLRTISILAGALAMALTPPAGAQGVEEVAVPPPSLTTDEIVAASLNPGCLRYRPVGACFFLNCTPLGCIVETSVRVAHYLPDAVVSSYQRTSENPWVEAQPVLSLANGALAILGPLLSPFTDLLSRVPIGGGHQTEGDTNIHSTVRFKEVSLVGNPIVTPLAMLAAGETPAAPTGNEIVMPESSVAIAPGEALSETLNGIAGIAEDVGVTGGGYLCSSQAKSFEPYFFSAVDPEWRLGLTESPIAEILRVIRGGQSSLPSLVPGLREVGTLSVEDFDSIDDLDDVLAANTWGSVHPRTGFLASPEDPKAAAVMAQRGADIVTRTDPGGHFVVHYLGFRDDNIEGVAKEAPEAERNCTAELVHPVVGTGGDTNESCGPGCEPPGPVCEMEPQSARWQMLTPQRRECEVFGQNDVFAEGWAVGIRDLQTPRPQDYVWNLWRPYRCCTDADGQFVAFVQVPGGGEAQGELSEDLQAAVDERLQSAIDEMLAEREEAAQEEGSTIVPIGELDEAELDALEKEMGEALEGTVDELAGQIDASDLEGGR